MRKRRAGERALKFRENTARPLFSWSIDFFLSLSLKKNPRLTDNVTIYWSELADLGGCSSGVLPNEVPGLSRSGRDGRSSILMEC